MDDLIKGIRWLAETGRNGAKKLQAAIEDDEQLSADWDEASEWLRDIADGNEIS